MRAAEDEDGDEGRGVRRGSQEEEGGGLDEDLMRT